MKIFIYLLLILTMMTSCDSSFRHPNGVNAVVDEETNQSYRIGYNLSKDGSLNKAFILHPSLDYTDKKENNGVYWIKHEPDTLWVNGKKINYPESCRVIAIKADGSISPINCSKKQLDLFQPGSEIYSEKDFINSKILPAFK